MGPHHHPRWPARPWQRVLRRCRSMRLGPTTGWPPQRDCGPKRRAPCSSRPRAARVARARRARPSARQRVCLRQCRPQMPNHQRQPRPRWRTARRSRLWEMTTSTACKPLHTKHAARCRAHWGSLARPGCWRSIDVRPEGPAICVSAWPNARRSCASRCRCAPNGAAPSSALGAAPPIAHRSRHGDPNSSPSSR